MLLSFLGVTMPTMVVVAIGACCAVARSETHKSRAGVLLQVAVSCVVGAIITAGIAALANQIIPQVIHLIALVSGYKGISALEKMWEKISAL
jgi:apolipoprotein N-acyltransferase